jgi:hypothetical protein
MQKTKQNNNNNKNLNKPRIEVNFFNTRKDIYGKPTANVILGVKK